MKEVVDAIYNLLAVIGAAATAAMAGLYQSGFFHWAATNMPENPVLQFFFGNTP